MVRPDSNDSIDSGDSDTIPNSLIIGEEGNAFSWKGDSGKVIVTDDKEHRPVGLLWGGWQERFRNGCARVRNMRCGAM